MRGPELVSVHAKITSCPARVTCGTPLALAADVRVIGVSAPSSPSAATWRAMIRASLAPLSSQETSELPSGSNVIPTRPMGLPPSARTGSAKRCPPSSENATRTRGGVHGGPVHGAAGDLPSVRVQRVRLGPPAALEAHERDVADLVGTPIAVGHEQPARRGDGRGLAAVTGARIQLLLILGDARGVQYRSVQSHVGPRALALRVPDEVLAVQPDRVHACVRRRERGEP